MKYEKTPVELCVATIKPRTWGHGLTLSKVAGGELAIYRFIDSYSSVLSLLSRSRGRLNMAKHWYFS